MKMKLSEMTCKCGIKGQIGHRFICEKAYVCDAELEGLNKDGEDFIFWYPFGS